MKQIDNPPGDGADETVADERPVTALTEDFFREQAARIEAEACREAAGGDPPSSYGSSARY